MHVRTRALHGVLMMITSFMEKVRSQAPSSQAVSHSPYPRAAQGCSCSQGAAGSSQPGSAPNKGFCPIFAPTLPSPGPALPPLNPSSLLLLSPRTGTALKITSHSSRCTSQSWESCWVTSAFSIVASIAPEFQLQKRFIASTHLSNKKEVREDGLGSISLLLCLLVSPILMLREA